MKEKLLHFFKPPFLQRLAYHFCNTLMLTNQAQYVISSNWITGEFLLCLNEIYRLLHEGMMTKKAKNRIYSNIMRAFSKFLLS